MLKNIIMDMGNVLLRYNPDMALEVFCESDKAREIIKKELFNGEEWVQGDLGFMTPKEMYASICKRIPEEYHFELECCLEYWDVCMKPLNGAVYFLNRMESRGYNIYVLTNASSQFYNYFPFSYPLEFFDGIVVSSDVHLIKPDKRIYTYLLDKYNLTAEECLFIDDTPENIEGAKAVGINGYVFDGDFEKLFEYVINNYAEAI